MKLSLIKSLVHSLARVSHIVNIFCWALAGACLIVMLLAVGIQVTGRYLLFSAPSWTEELARYAMVWAGLVGATVSFYERQDPVIVNLPLPKSKGLNRLVESVKAIPVLVFIAPLIYYSPLVITHHMDRLTESLKITSAYVLLVVPIFAWIILLHQSSRLLSAYLNDSTSSQN